MSRVRKKMSVGSAVEIILIVILVLVMVIMLAFNFLFKNNSAASIFGYSFYNTKAVNMIPKIPKNTLVIVKKSEVPNIVNGSVILCNIGEYKTLIRVKEVQHEDDKTYYLVKFDVAPDNEAIRIEADDVIAKAVWQINGFGSFLDFATSTVGIIIAVVIPLIFIIAIQVARILGIRRLEDEAASLDDIDEFMQSRDEKEPAAVTFTEPKFVEDVTGKLPLASEREEKPVSEKVLSFDNRGRAEYIERRPETKQESPLFTYDRLTGKSERGQQSTGQTVSRDDMYLNRPTRIEPDKSPADELFEKYVVSDKGEPVVFTPHMSNIIPDSIAAVQEETASEKNTGFDDSVKSYFEKSTPKNVGEDAVISNEDPAIPQNAVLPKETIAPPKKQKNNKALAELMSIIDAEENKLKK